MIRSATLMLLLSVVLIPSPVHGQTPAPCDAPVYGQLDFWLGKWRVNTSDGQFAGDNVIEKILDGCAVMEHWSGAGGNTGKSLFYVVDGQWRQVWVTHRRGYPGAVKEKRLIHHFDNGAVRFQGRISTPGGSYLDRTTLTPKDDGTVTQVIEISRDDRQKWVVVFDAVYSPVE